MEGLFRNIQINMKRIYRLLPFILAGTILLSGCVLIGAYVQKCNNDNNKSKIKIGVVGDLDNSYIKNGITALQSMDTTRYIIELVTVSEEEAASMIRTGKLSAYMLVPKDFTHSISYGYNNIKVDYVCGEGDTGLVGKVMEEIVDAFSEYVTGSQSVIYATGSVNKKINGNRLSGQQNIDLNMRCINSVLNRERLSEVQLLGLGHNLSSSAYFFCGMLVAFLFLSGINSCMYFSGRSREFQKISIARGQKIWQQLLGEYIPFLIVLLCITACVWIFLTMAVSLELLLIDEWAGNAVENLWKMYVYLIPVVVFVSIIQMLVYEIIDNLIGSILMQFILSICMGYMSGCFYPEQFFPETVMNISNVFPNKMAMSYVAAYFTGNHKLINYIGILGYSLISVILIYIFRKRRIRQ